LLVSGVRGERESERPETGERRPESSAFAFAISFTFTAEGAGLIGLVTPASGLDGCAELTQGGVRSSLSHPPTNLPIPFRHLAGLACYAPLARVARGAIDLGSWAFSSPVSAGVDLRS
jgi:hypothetical protein